MPSFLHPERPLPLDSQARQIALRLYEAVRDLEDDIVALRAQIGEALAIDDPRARKALFEALV